MQVYIALLRGINVSGHNKIRMTDLKELFLKVGFSDASTYIQSGNVVFKSALKDTASMEDTITKAIKESLGYSVKVLVITKNELNFIYESNPFLVENKSADTSKLGVTLLKDKPNEEGIKLLNSVVISNSDEFKMIEKIVYLCVPNGFGITKLTNNLFENKLKTDATSRNWRTITKLIELTNY